MKIAIAVSMFCAIGLGLYFAFMFPADMPHRKGAALLNTCVRLGVSSELDTPSPDGRFGITSLSRPTYATLKIRDTRSGEEAVLDTRWPSTCFHDVVWTDNDARVYYATTEQDRTDISYVDLPSGYSSIDTAAVSSIYISGLNGPFRLNSIQGEVATVLSQDIEYLVSLSNTFPPTPIENLGPFIVGNLIPFDVDVPDGWSKQQTYYEYNSVRTAGPAVGYGVHPIENTEEDYVATAYIGVMAYHINPDAPLDDVMSLVDESVLPYEAQATRTTESVELGGLPALHRVLENILAEGAGTSYREEIYLTRLPDQRMLQMTVMYPSEDVYQQQRADVHSIVASLRIRTADE